MARKRDPLELNKREKDILKFIETELNENGYPPSVREIGKAVGLKSTATVHSYLGRLEDGGYISRKDKKGRTLQLIRGGKPYKPAQSEDKSVYSGKEMVEVPVVGRITAGAPILAVENITDTFPIPLDFIGNSDCFMLTVRGESMIEAGIMNGDYILVKKQNTAENGEIVVALIDDEATVKTFYKEKDHIRLQPENSTMDPIIVPNCEILGKVAGLGAGCPILAVTDNRRTFNQLALAWNVTPVFVEKAESIDATVENGIKKLQDKGILEKGDTIVISGGPSILKNAEESKIVASVAKV